MTARLLVLFLAVYRLTLLVTADRITRKPRRAILGWLNRRAHHLAESSDLVAARSYRCSCGWGVARLEGYPATAATVDEPLPSVLAAIDLPRDGIVDLAATYRSHVADHADDVGRFGSLLTCPWCVSVYLGAVGAAVWAWWPAGPWYWPALALALSGFTGLAASLGSPHDGDDDA